MSVNRSVDFLLACAKVMFLVLLIIVSVIVAWGAFFVFGMSFDSGTKSIHFLLTPIFILVELFLVFVIYLSSKVILGVLFQSEKVVSFTFGR